MVSSVIRSMVMETAKDIELISPFLLIQEEAIRRSLQDLKLQQKDVAKPEPSAPVEDTLSSVCSGSDNSIKEVKAVDTKAAVEKIQVETVNEEEDRPATQEVSSVASSRVEVMMPSDGSFATDVSPVKSAGSVESPSKPKIKEISDEKKGGEWEPSFSSDAAGNGDVADLLGETLDRCAEAISAMVNELDRTPSRDNDSSSDSSSTSSFVGVGEADEAPVEEDIVVEPELTDVATILESVGGGPSKEAEAPPTSERTEDGWQVVADDNQVNSDEELARAAQMVGSALFHSDMRSSGEMVSTLTGSAPGSDAFSYASSVPTSVPSITTSGNVTAGQLERWAPQLHQLQEMGFDDQAQCIEILEKLTAANIGVDSTDEISVQQVVNELWRN
jgi:hypothetical protein